MIKRYCDCCGKEMDESLSNKFKYLFHIDGILDRIVGLGYVDRDGNIFSRREVSKELCNNCYNRVVIESVKKFRELKEFYNE